jgi:hypothetical protein
MKVAIMQPYFLPYLGYFQLIAAVDRFVIYDDVQYMKGGYVNRNAIQIRGTKSHMTVPLQKASPNRLIHEIEIVAGDHWRRKLLKTIGFAYAKAPHYDAVFPLVEDIVGNMETNLSSFLQHAITRVCDYLDIGTQIIPTSRIYENRHLDRVERVIDIVQRCGGNTYINPIGGVELYDKQEFAHQGIELQFLEMKPVRYHQLTQHFVANLSILDLIMFNSKTAMTSLLGEYRLV